MKTCKNIFRLILLFFIFLQSPTGFTEQVSIPAGSFQMGCSLDDNACETDEGPAGGTMVVVPAFMIDTFEVTVSKYRQCVNNGNCTRPIDYKRNKYCNYDAPGRDNHPVNCLAWQQAQDYCYSTNQRLPREAEWEKAARAGSTARYPWGQEVTCKQAVLDDGVTRGSAGDETDGCGEDHTWPAGSHEPNALGLYDMHGNAGEWTANWYTPDAIWNYYAKVDLDGPAMGKRRVVRGGSWDEIRNNLRSSYRNAKAPDQGNNIYGSIGFRCAADLQ